MFARLKLRQALALVVLGGLLTFQNCSDAPSNNDQTQSSYNESLPFAYSAKVDTVAYMSCSEIKTSVENRAYFSYRVGAYNNSTGGLTLTDPFRTATQYYQTADRANAFAQSDLNSNTRLNLSVRLRSNSQSVWSTGSTRAGFEIDSFLPQLDSPDVAGPLAGVANGRMMNYFPGSGAQRLMEASLRFFEFENVSVETRNNLEGSGSPAYLAVAYSNTADELDTSVRVPGVNPVNSTQPVTAAMAYGTGYAFTFALPAGTTAGERRVISSLQEVDLSTSRNVAAAWDCSSSYQFMILRPEDVAAGLVTCATGPDLATSSQTAALNAVRRVLRVEDWYVDMNRHCVVPKNTGDYCYGSLQSGQSIQYTSVACTNSGATLCPHWVSVCIRH
jgi:hypothetical protein